jgi:nitrous oxidase accessory protein NosD
MKLLQECRYFHFSPKALAVILFVGMFLASAWAGEAISVPSLGIISISQAMISAKNGDSIWVSDGVYKERIFIKSGVALIARNKFKAIIDGGGKGTVVTLGTRSTIRGF